MGQPSIFSERYFISLYDDINIDIFERQNNGSGRTKVMKCKIDTGGAKPIRQIAGQATN